METLVGFLVILALPGYVVLQAWTVRSYGGGWRIAALVPLLVMIPLLAYSAVAFAGGSNLWPLMLVLAAPFACTYLAIVMAARGVTDIARADALPGGQRPILADLTAATRPKSAKLRLFAAATRI